MIDPYKLLLELRDNKILFSYMDTVAVYVEDDQWFIIGDSDEGELKINLTGSNVLRLGIPVSVPSELPPAVLEDVLTKMEPEFDGLLKAELDVTFKEYIIYYYIHVGLSDLDEDLSTALIRFKQDKRNIDKALNSVLKTLNKVKFDLSQSLTKEPNSSSSNNIWDDMNKLDKEFPSDQDEDSDPSD